MSFDEVGTLSEHTAGAAGGIEDAAMIRLDDLHDELDDRRGGEELTTPLPICPCEVAEKVFVNLAERVALFVDVDLREVLEQGDERGVLDLRIAAGQHALEVVVLRLDELIASLIALPMLSPSVRDNRCEKRASGGRYITPFA